VAVSKGPRKTPLLNSTESMAGSPRSGRSIRYSLWNKQASPNERPR
jgi:hypothetical protein